ncbi:MAG: HEAT repeat domain-containing protein, partial [Zavarzinella sp.]|nr:HEAT repeat domain-containing protein [Zavarzinella sp.]
MIRLTHNACLGLVLFSLCAPVNADDEKKELGKTKAQWLKVLAEDPSARQREAAVKILTVWEPRDRAIVDAVREALNDKAERVRLAAVNGVGVFVVVSEVKESGSLLESIGRVLGNDSAESVRQRALDVVRELKKDEQQRKMVPFVADAMKADKSPAIRAAAAASLGRMGSNARTVVNVMIESLKDPDAAVRAAVAEGLGRIGDEAKSAISRLIPLLKDQDAGVRLSAAFALGRIGPEAATAVPDLAHTLATDADTSVRKEAARAFALLGLDAKEAIPALAKALREDKSEEVRQHAALALGKMRGEEVHAVAPAMIEAMKKDPDKAVRIFSVHALGNALGPTLRDFVKDLADQLPKEKEGEVRLAIVQELGALGPDAKEALPVLQQMVTDVQITVRDAAKQAV